MKIQQKNELFSSFAKKIALEVADPTKLRDLIEKIREVGASYSYTVGDSVLCRVSWNPEDHFLVDSDLESSVAGIPLFQVLVVEKTRYIETIERNLDQHPDIVDPYHFALCWCCEEDNLFVLWVDDSREVVDDTLALLKSAIRDRLASIERRILSCSQSSSEHRVLSEILGYDIPFLALPEALQKLKLEELIWSLERKVTFRDIQKEVCYIRKDRLEQITKDLIAPAIDDLDISLVTRSDIFAYLLNQSKEVYLLNLLNKVESKLKDKASSYRVNRLKLGKLIGFLCSVREQSSDKNSIDEALSPILGSFKDATFDLSLLSVRKLKFLAIYNNKKLRVRIPWVGLKVQAKYKKGLTKIAEVVDLFDVIEVDGLNHPKSEARKGLVLSPHIEEFLTLSDKVVLSENTKLMLDLLDRVSFSH